MKYGIDKQTYKPANFVGSHPTITEGVTLAKGEARQVILAGTVLGRITEGGKCVPWTPTADDGSQTPMGILVADTAVSTAADEPAAVDVHGNFLREGLGGGEAGAAQITAAVATLRAAGIYVK